MISPDQDEVAALLRVAKSLKKTCPATVREWGPLVVYAADNDKEAVETVLRTLVELGSLLDRYGPLLTRRSKAARLARDEVRQVTESLPWRRVEDDLAVRKSTMSRTSLRGLTRGLSVFQLGQQRPQVVEPLSGLCGVNRQ